jgi:hypothetical protein
VTGRLRRAGGLAGKFFDTLAGLFEHVGCKAKVLCNRYHGIFFVVAELRVLGRFQIQRS